MRLTINYDDGVTDRVIGIWDAPDNAEGIYPLWQTAKTELRRGSDDFISIPRLKKKVWKWWTLANGVRVTTDDWMVAPPPPFNSRLDWHKVEGSEKEIEG